MKRGGNMQNFPQFVKKMHIFPPIDKKFTKLHKKILNIFTCGAHPVIILNFIGEKI